MNNSNKSQQNFCWLLRNSTRYSLTLLLSAVLLSESVGALQRSTTLKIEQSKQGNSITDIHTVAEQAHANLFSHKAAVRIPASINLKSFLVKMAQSATTKPQNMNLVPSQAEARVKPLLDKALQRSKEANQLRKEPLATAKRQTIAKYEEALKIWRLLEVRAEYLEMFACLKLSHFLQLGVMLESLS
ncbi:MAG: hypothetical protein IGS49_25335 [Chlorogloeopsis fritschii C42_A2020_084]|uniref:hypothetical protein n=1 Tax=Chlorogloeopsis fritschii TaxID=1124 RepID=UPI0019F4C817|nr:hypothetical protein [Chlorogloeopsis fritschii]MBF2008677.1 hypothetical protein [Chlorogloeopsis fritschii C42_A2020_084]